jgi:LysM repeat protein
MRWRVILGLSLVANLLLTLGWFWSGRAKHPAPAPNAATTNSLNTTNVRTAVIVRRQFFSWQELESQDYPTYIKNLREIGCPEQTIRDIIIADVTEMLRARRLEQTPKSKPNPKWWTNHRENEDEDAEARAANKMWAERGAILEQLLGPGWAIRGRPVIPQTNSFQNLVIATMETNPLLQGLPAEKKQVVADLLSRAQPGGGSEVQASGSTWNPQPAAAAQKEVWGKLSELLTVSQLEAVKLHFSMQAEDLRNELDYLPGFDTRPEEFKKIFTSTEAIDAQLYALADRDDDAAQTLRTKLLAERETAVRAALSPERYEQYARLRDPAYLTALEKLAEAKGNPGAIALLYAINREATAEQERIETDPTLSETQREIELKRLELEQLKATALALGEELLDEPGQKPPTPKPEPSKVHRVAAGEGLDRIARIYGVDAAALRAANPGVNFDKLPPGTSVNVPLRLMYPLPPPN